MKQKNLINRTKCSTSRLILIATFLLINLSTFAQSGKGGIHIGLVYPISNHGSQAQEYTNTFSFHAFGGVSQSEKAFTLSGFTNVITDNANGVQIGGFSNHIKHAASGVQLAGFVNTYGSGNGLQAAGFTNVAAYNVKGVQLSGFFNKAGQTKGVQLSGFSNIAKDVTGAQVSGFVNIARKVKGVQLSGFVNIADSSDYPIGIINLIKHGEKTIGISADETQNALVSFRSGGRVLYGIIGAGYNFKNENEVYAVEAGLGAHIGLSPAFRINAEAATVTLTDFKEDGSYLKSSLRLLPAVRLYKGVELFAGPTFNYVYTNTTEGKALAPHHMWEKSKDDYLHLFYVGIIGGIQYRL